MWFGTGTLETAAAHTHTHAIIHPSWKQGQSWPAAQKPSLEAWWVQCCRVRVLRLTLSTEAPVPVLASCSLAPHLLHRRIPPSSTAKPDPQHGIQKYLLGCVRLRLTPALLEG